MPIPVVNQAVDIACFIAKGEAWRGESSFRKPFNQAFGLPLLGFCLRS